MCHSFRENIVYLHRIPELQQQPWGQRGAMILTVRQQAWLQTNWLALPHGLLPTQTGHKLWGLRHLPLLPSLAEKANLALLGDSDHREGGRKLEKAGEPTKLWEIKPSSEHRVGSCQFRVCKSVWSKPRGAVSQLWPRQRQKASSTSAFVLKSNFFSLPSPPKRGIMGIFLS